MISRQLARLGVAMESGSRPSLGQVILLGTSSMVTAVLYSIYRQKAQVAQELKVSAESGQDSLAAHVRTHWGTTGSPEGTPATCCIEAAPPLRSGVLRVTLSVIGRHRSAVKLFLENLLCTR